MNIQAFFESEEGKREYEEWIRAQENEKDNESDAAK